MNLVQVCAPMSLASKTLKIKQLAGGRKIQISTNLLMFFGFEAGTPVFEEACEGTHQGYRVRLAEGLPITNVKKIYSRTYKQRKNNPFETLYESTSKKILKTIPEHCTHVHVTFRHGIMHIKPVINNVVERIAKVMKAINPFTVFSACTSGIDAHAAQESGFKIQSILEYRPQEKRDKRDLSETGLMCALSNVEVEHVFNEDITTVSTEYLDWATKDHQSSLFTISLQCDDFSVTKGAKLKQLSEVDLSSTLDMAYDGLRIIEKLQFPMVLLEQVVPFGTSEIGRMWDLRLRKMGYKTYSKVIDARDHNGLTSRSRFFHFATTLPEEFSWPVESARNEETLWDLLIAERIEEFRDVSHTKSMQDGVTTGRIRPIKSTSTWSPSVLKSQPRQAKDSVVIMEDNGTIRFPDEQLLRDLMGLPESFCLNSVNKEQGTEIIGQGVDHPLYKKIILSVKEHMNKFLSKKDDFDLQAYALSS